jgi:hypothetical protein
VFTLAEQMLCVSSVLPTFRSTRKDGADTPGFCASVSSCQFLVLSFWICSARLGLFYALQNFRFGEGVVGGFGFFVDEFHDFV